MVLKSLKIVLSHGFMFLILILINNSCSPETTFNGELPVANINFSFNAEDDFSGSIIGKDKFVVNGVNGSILFKHTDQNEYTVSVSKTIFSESESDAKEYMSNLRVTVESAGGAIIISTIQPEDNGGRILKVNYEIEVPKYLALEVVQDNGDVTLDSVFSETKIEMTNGIVELVDHDSSVDIMLVNGNVVGNVYVPANIEGLCAISIINGTIDLRLPIETSAQFSASLVNGSYTISDSLDLQNIIRTENSISGTLNQGDGTVDLNVENGIIQVEEY